MLPSLIAPRAAAKAMAERTVVVLEGSFYLPSANVDVAAERRRQRIAGSQWFNIDVTADKSTTLPHMLPSEEVFRRRMWQARIVTRDQPVIVYDTNGWSAPRTWWTLRAYGCHNVSIMDGGLKAWSEAGLDTVGGEEPPLPTPSSPQEYIALPFVLNRTVVRTKQQMLDNLTTRRSVVVDARSLERFRGEVPEPRPNLRRGHIPNSLCIPFTSLVDVPNARFHPVDKLRAVLREQGIDPLQPQPEQHIITTCGSGVTAAVISFALHLVRGGISLDDALYDGSFSEWGLPDAGTPVETASSSPSSSSSSAAPASKL